MSQYALPALYTMFLWWFSTGLILFLDRLPRRTFRWSMLGATAVLAASLHGLITSSAMTDVLGAYVAFTSALMIWGWLEMAFLMGFVTGPRKHACAAGCRGWRHFLHAVGALLYHELSIVACAGMVVALTWGEPNQIGTWSFLILWGMRQSAKLNLFFGVPNLNVELLPAHLQFLKAYLNKRPMNLLFPFSIVVSTVIASLAIEAALMAEASAFEAAGLTLLGTLLVLAILEHWFLVLPLPVNALWSWSLRHPRSTDEKGIAEDREPWLPGADRGSGQELVHAWAPAARRIRAGVARIQTSGRSRIIPSNNWRRS